MKFRVIGSAANGEATLALAAAHKPALALMDIRLRGTIDGIETAARLGRISGVPVVFLTAHSDASTTARAMQTRPLSYLTKPFDRQALRAVLETALQQQASRHARPLVADNVTAFTPHATPPLRDE
jgi:DNA-binding NarL/FixJ family response regulator